MLSTEAQPEVEGAARADQQGRLGLTARQGRQASRALLGLERQAQAERRGQSVLAVELPDPPDHPVPRALRERPVRASLERPALQALRVPRGRLALSGPRVPELLVRLALRARRVLRGRRGPLAPERLALRVPRAQPEARARPEQQVQVRQERRAPLDRLARAAALLALRERLARRGPRVRQALA